MYFFCIAGDSLEEIRCLEKIKLSCSEVRDATLGAGIRDLQVGKSDRVQARSKSVSYE